jgi:hypothetical protein
MAKAFCRPIFLCMFRSPKLILLRKESIINRLGVALREDR